MNVTANAGPFLVQAPNGGGTVVGNTQLPVSWTYVHGNGINCSSVDIYLSTDGVHIPDVARGWHAERWKRFGVGPT